MDSWGLIYTTMGLRNRTPTSVIRDENREKSLKELAKLNQEQKIASPKHFGSAAFGNRLLRNAVGRLWANSGTSGGRVMNLGQI